jgi:hypothetical protein
MRSPKISLIDLLGGIDSTEIRVLVERLLKLLNGPEPSTGEPFGFERLQLWSTVIANAEIIANGSDVDFRIEALPLRAEVSRKGGEETEIRATISMGSEREFFFLALAVFAENRPRLYLRHCPTCKLWFQADRKDAFACSNACRTKASRARLRLVRPSAPPKPQA